MERAKHLPDTRIMAWLLVAVGTLGLGLSMALTQDTRWMQWHMSRLGEGGHLSSAIFNFSLIVAALLMTAIAYRISYDFELSGKTRGLKQFRLLAVLMAVGWAGVALFPFDEFPIVHNVFGYGMFLMGCVLMMGLAKIAPYFSRRTYLIGAATVLTSGTLMALHHLTHLTTLLVVELVTEMLFLSWLTSLAYDASAQQRIGRPQKLWLGLFNGNRR